MASNKNFVIRYSEGTGRNLGKAVNKTKSLHNFKNMLRKPVRTNERMKDFMKLPDAEQAHLKGVAGWLYRTGIEGNKRNRRSGLPADIATFDFDYATPEFLQALRDREIMPEWEWFLHTSRRHTPETPRFRLFVPLKEPVANDFYNAASRIIAEHFDPEMVHVDKVSFRPAQMMYKPTASRDGEFIFHENNGDLVDWQALLDDYELVRGDWRDVTNLPKVPNEHLRETAEKMEDPTTKEGPVGDFCRAYDIFEAIDAFDLPYTPVDDPTSNEARFTYAGGTTYNGAIVYDGGLFLYSHHGSDPVADMEVNAFDLVRLHKFGDKDEADDMDKPMAQRPSWKEMIAFARKDPKFKAEQLKSRYDLAEFGDDMGDDMVAEEGDEEDEDTAPEADEDDGDDFDDIDIPEESKPDPGESGDLVVGLNTAGGIFTRPKRAKAVKGWMNDLALTKDGDIVPNLPNVTVILDNDPRTRNSLAFNEHMQEIVLIRPLDSRLSYVPKHDVRDSVNGDLWIDAHTAAVRTFMEAENGAGKRGYGFRPADRDVKAGLTNMSRRAKFHPIQEYLNFCADNHGPQSIQAAQSRVESLWIDYMGSPDDAYHRATALKFMVACVARAFEPGHKFDYSPILHGAQGVGKSTFVAILAQHWYGELSADFSNPQKLVEQMQGCWVMELPELSSITRGQIEDVKAFISGTAIKARLAYNARAESYLRQTCFIGSTNDTEFLIDTTGNRRWWPIEVTVNAIDLDKLRSEIMELWGAATVLYRAMRAEQPEGYLPFHLSDPKVREQAEKMQYSVQTESDVGVLASEIADFLDKKIEPEDDFYDAADQKSKRMWRERVCIAQIKDYLDMPKNTPPTWARTVGKALKQLGWKASNHPEKIPGYGKPRVYKPGPAVRAERVRQDLEDAKGSGDDDFTDLV